MKQKLLHLLSVFVAIVASIPIANAAASDYSVAKQTPGEVWKKTFTVPGSDARQMAVLPNGYMYVIGTSTNIPGYSYKTLYRINENGVQSGSSGYTSLGHGMAADDNGKIGIITQGFSTTVNLDKDFSLRKPDATGHLTYVSGSSEIDLTAATIPAYTYYFDATGDIENGTGYLWFPPVASNNRLKVLKTVRNSGSATWTTTYNYYTLPFTPTSSDSYMHVYESIPSSNTWRFLFFNPFGDIYDCTLSNGTITATAIALPVARKHQACSNAHIFFLGGHKMLAYNTGNNNGAANVKANQFVIYDITTKTEIATVQPFTAKVSGSAGNIGSWINSLKVSETQTDLFVYSPGVGASRLSLIATPITAPVTSQKAAIVSGSPYNVNVSWAKPSQGTATKYSITYSSNGGTSWSSAVETNNLNYTFSNLPVGTYTFKVKAYFGGSSTWGAEATTNSLTISDPTNPVASLSASLVSGTTNDVNVVWTKPTVGTASKYSVCYSSDGGATWSAAVETTSLSYTYSNLPAGTYQFKVKPFYTTAWGSETTSNSVTTADPSTPVGSVGVALVEGTLDDVTVIWTKPSVATPTKYAVSYSNNGGTTWSAAVETNNLSYTFNNLTPGTYIFKVQPYYTNSWGNEALTQSIEVYAPTGYTFTTTKLWEVRGTWGTDAAPDGRSVAVSNNKMYVASPHTGTKVAYISQGTPSDAWPTFETGFDVQYYGLAMDNDDAGNIIMASGVYFGAGDGMSQLTIYPSGATSNANKIDITLSGDYLPGSRCDFIAAQGNLLSAAGGYVWLAPVKGQKIMRIKIANGALAGITTWKQTMSSTSNTNQIVLRPLDDGRLYFHFRGTGYRIITLPPAGEEITADMVETIPATGYAYNPYSNVNSDMFTLQGYNFHVRNDGAEAKSIGVEIKNLTDVGNGDASFIPFDGLTPAGGTSSVTKVDGYGSLVRAVNVDDLTTDVYCYTINHGVTVYRVTAKAVHVPTDALSDLTYNYEKVDNQQNIELTWVAPDEATPVAYKIYRDGALLATVDASTLTYIDYGVNQNYTYKVVPIFAGATENGDLGLEVETSGVETILNAPLITETRSYDGYSITQIFYKMPDNNKVKPASFNIYRDGVLLETGMTQYNYIDDDLPKTSTNQSYVYTIEAVYSDTYDNATRISEGKSVEVTPRDWAMTGYRIEELYNVPINPALGNLPQNFTNHEYYRQGYFYDGHWYIAQLADQLSRKDQGIEGGSINQSDVEGATGGVVAIKAVEEIDVRTGFLNGKVITSDEFASAGLAMDDEGTIFMRHNNLEKLKATVPIGTTWYSGMYDAYDRRITEGALYVRDENGNYPSEPTAIIDLQALWTNDDWINNMYFTGATSYGQVIGRSDYFNMYGDVMSAEGGYLLISPSWTRTIFKVKVVNGAYDSHETLEFHDYTDINSNGEEEVHKVATGTENYGFKIDGRDAWMAQIRSNGYFGIHGVSEDHQGEEHDHEWHAIYDVDSRVNNSGGTSIVAFNSEEGKSDGETFLITPACMHSRNQGDFLVTRGEKEDVSDDASTSILSPPIPVAQYRQSTQNTNIATNANGNWFHAELGTYASAMSETDECVYIYQYVPGVRFAKYRLYPDIQFPAIFPTLEITTKYDNEEKPTEITHFGGVATWQRPAGFGVTDANNSNVKVKSYTFELLNAEGNVVYSDEVPDNNYVAGTTPDYNSDEVNYAFDYFVDNNIASTEECDLDFQTYTARVAVNYEFQTGNNDIYQSDFGYARANNTYTEAAAEDLGVWVYKNANTTQQVWEEVDGKWVVVDKKVDAYRVELDFSKPSEQNTTEPVSYYTIKAIVNNQTDTIDITDFHLHKGMEVVNGIEQAVLDRDNEGNVIPTSQIPGTYDFENFKAPFYHKENAPYEGTGQSRRKGVLTWHHIVPAGSYANGVAQTANGEEVVITDEPNKWVFIVEAHYAARNRYIAKIADNDIAPEGQEMIETGVEVIGSDAVSSLQIYPIPASTSITIKSNEAINTIVIYNEAGIEVMNLDGDGDTVAEVNIENLATGYYFVKVNEKTPVKIIKK